MREFKIKKKKLGNIEIFFRKKRDFRGNLSRIFCVNQLGKLFKNRKIKQINYTSTKKAGTIRGMHYQSKPFEEDKIVLCLKGRVFDVALDLRKNSKSFLKTDVTILSDKKKNMHLIPRGFAHGYQSLTDNCELIYFHTNFYSKENSKTICPIRNKFQIYWPLKKIIISKKDKLGKKY